MSLAYLDTAIALIVVLLTVSLVVTVLTQIVGTTLSLRGSSLRWGLIQLVSVVVPGADAHAARIVDAALRHPMVSDSVFARFGRKGMFLGRWALATAIRLEELVGVLELMARGPKPAGVSDDDWTAERQVMQHIAASARSDVGPQVAAVAGQASDLLKTVGQIPPGTSLQVGELLNRVPATAEAMLTPDIKSWFNASMDRVTQRFLLRTRAVTVTLSVLAAFALHLDSLALLRQFSAQPELRASLVGVSAAVERVGAEVLRERRDLEAGPTSAPHVPALYGEAMSDTRTASVTDPQASGEERARRQQLWSGLGDRFAFRSRDAGEAWIRGHFAGADADRLSATYARRVDELLEAGTGTDRLLDQSSTLAALMEGSRFNLVPRPYHSWDYLPLAPSFDWRHLVGVLITAAFLSLGAPFWFNALKTVTALKPVVATRAAEEQRAA